MVKKSYETNELLDLVTNTGILRTNLKATIPGLKEAWLNPYAITITFSYTGIANHYQIAYDLTKEKQGCKTTVFFVVV